METTTLPTDEESEVPTWVSRAAFPIILVFFYLAQVLMAVAIHNHWIWVALLLIPVLSHLMHGQLIALHEASHTLLRKNRFFNDLDGFLIAAFSLMSFTLYRAAHQTHHMHLSSERDEELWPFVLPSVPRWKRIAAAIAELSCGYLFTPFIFFRTFVRRDSPIRAPRIRRRIWREFALVAVMWILILGAVSHFDLWQYFFGMYLIPALIAGNLQSWRKYIEHVGMTGNTPNSATRSIVCDTWSGKLVSFTLLHEPYHGIHHELSGIPHAELPQHTPLLDPKAPDEVAPFPSYRHALLHLCRSLADPRVGGQWGKTA